MRHFDRALAYWEHSPLPARAESISGRARVTQLQGDARYAIHILEDYLDELDRKGLRDPTAQMRSHTTLVQVYFAAGMPERAIEAAHEALRLEPLVEDPGQIATMHLNVARSLLVSGHIDSALRSLHKAEMMHTQLQRRHDAAYAQIASGIVLAAENRLDAAKDALEEGLQVLEVHPARLYNARGLTELARVERLRGDARRARVLLNEALGLLGDSDPCELALVHRELALCSLADDRDAAERHLWQAVELYGQVRDAMKQATVYRLLGNKLREDGDVLGALDAYHAGLELVERAQSYSS